MQLTYCPLRVSNLATLKIYIFIALGRRNYGDLNICRPLGILK